jgi:hypothetical protein
MLFALGGDDAQGRTLLYAWDRGGLGREWRMTYCDSSNTGTSVGTPGTAVLRFDVTSLTLSVPPTDGLTFAPNREGLAIEGWFNGRNPMLNSQGLPFKDYDTARSLAIAPDAKRFFQGSLFALGGYDNTGALKWRWLSRNEIWAVNASEDGRVVVTADNDGAIRWHRADDGRELLAVQVLPNKNVDPTKWDWVLWTPEGFYEATPGAENVLKWVTSRTG